MSDGSGSWENHSIDEEKAFQGGTSEESEGSSDKRGSHGTREKPKTCYEYMYM